MIISVDEEKAFDKIQQIQHHFMLWMDQWPKSTPRNHQNIRGFDLWMSSKSYLARSRGDCIYFVWNYLNILYKRVVK